MYQGSHIHSRSTGWKLDHSLRGNLRTLRFLAKPTLIISSLHILLTSCFHSWFKLSKYPLFLWYWLLHVQLSLYPGTSFGAMYGGGCCMCICRFLIGRACYKYKPPSPFHHNSSIILTCMMISAFSFTDS